MTADLQGKRAVVTGAASGIGLALAKLLVEGGAKVVLADIDLAKVEAIAASLDGAIAVRCDVSDHASVEALAALAQAALGGIDLVFANAGTILNGPLPPPTPARALPVKVEGKVFQK